MTSFHNLLIKVKLHPNSSRQEIVKVDEENFTVYIHKPAIENKANLSLILLLASYFKVNHSSVTIIHGLKSKNKIVNIVID